jgi:hypothetical protein
MSHFVCPGCGRESDIFGKGGGEQLARDCQCRFSARAALRAGSASASDSGVPASSAIPLAVIGGACRCGRARGATGLDCVLLARCHSLVEVR